MIIAVMNKQMHDYEKGLIFFSGFTFTTASVAFMSVKNYHVFKTKQGGETVKCLLTKHFLMGQGLNLSRSRGSPVTSKIGWR